MCPMNLFSEHHQDVLLFQYPLPFFPPLYESASSHIFYLLSAKRLEIDIYTHHLHFSPPIYDQLT